MPLTIRKLVETWGVPKGKIEFDLEDSIGNICTDTRTLHKGDFFIPLVGSNYDGHSFIADAIRIGAKGAFVSRKSKISIPEQFLHWIVDDTLEAYQKLAFLHRSKLQIPVIAVTGSAGKTTTRELICAAIKPLGKVISSEGNNNNDIGVPLTLLKANSTNCALVLEMGMRGKGEIKRLSCCAHPDIAVITNVGSAHIGRLGNRTEIAKAKCEITSCLRPDGLVVIPAGDPLLEDVLGRNWQGRILRVAIQDDLSQAVSNHSQLSINKFPKPDLLGNVDLAKSTLLLGGKTYHLPLEGLHNARNFMIALAVAREIGVAQNKLTNLSVSIPGGRSRRTKIGQLTIIDDTYNASPEAVEAALDMLVRSPGRHFAVLGTMMELGNHSVALHKRIAEHAVSLELDGLVLVVIGEEAEAMASVAGVIPRFAIVNSPQEAIKPLLSWLESGDVVLLKASRSISMERLLPYFEANQFP